MQNLLMRYVLLRFALPLDFLSRTFSFLTHLPQLYELKIKILDAQRKRSKTTKQGIEAVSAAFAEREKVEKVTAEKTAEAQRHVDGVNTAEARLKLITTRHGGMFATCEAASKYWEVVSDARAADLDAEQEVKVLKSRLGKLEEELVESALAVFDTKVRLALEELRLKFDNVGGLAAGYGKIQLKAVLYDAFRRVKEM